MKNNSIREALPRLAKYMILCMILLILPANIGFQMYIHHENQKASANEMFRQVGLLIETNEKDMEEVKNDFSERCIRAADMAAYFVQYNPEVKDSLERTRELAKSWMWTSFITFPEKGKFVAEPIQNITDFPLIPVSRCHFSCQCSRILH